MVTQSFFQARARAVRDALATAGSREAWRRCALIYAGFLIVGLPIGLASGLLHPSRPPMTASEALVAGLRMALYPAFTEELLFRVLLLPRHLDRVNRPRLIATAALALLAYVVAHPIGVYLVLPALLGLFSNPFYLALTALLGIACTSAYLTSGSIWPAVIIHWLTVVLWIFGLGGQALIQSALAR